MVEGFERFTGLAGASGLAELGAGVPPYFESDSPGRTKEAGSG
jgi:hypothetical protein